MPRPAAIVLGASVQALCHLRSLGRRGIPTRLVDARRTSSVASRFARWWAVPDPVASPERCLERLLSLGARLRVQGVLLPTSDAWVSFVSAHAEALRPRFRFLVPDDATARRIRSKRDQIETAASLGIAVPETHTPAGAEEVAHLAPRLRYPCIVKPVDAVLAPRLGAKVVLVPSAARLPGEWARASALTGAPCMIQEVVEGGDDALFGYLALHDGLGRERAWLVKRKLRQHPPGFGDGSLHETVDAPEVAAIGRRLVAAYGLRGLVGVECKRDARDGRLLLLEVNPRSVSGAALAVSAGVDLPWLAYRAALAPDEPAAAAHGPARLGVRYAHELWGLESCLAAPGSRLRALAAWARAALTADARALFAWDDPLPFFVAFASRWTRRIRSCSR